MKIRRKPVVEVFFNQIKASAGSKINYLILLRASIFCRKIKENRKSNKSIFTYQIPYRYQVNSAPFMFHFKHFFPKTNIVAIKGEICRQSPISFLWWKGESLSVVCEVAPPSRVRFRGSGKRGRTPAPGLTCTPPRGTRQIMLRQARTAQNCMLMDVTSVTF